MALLAIAAFLMSRGDAPATTATAPKVAFRRHMSEPERRRMEERRTLPPAPPSTPPQEDEPAPPPRDPVLAALPSVPGRSAIVMEANALRHSPVGELLVACLLQRDSEGLARMRDELGIDPLQDLDRVAIAGGLMLLSGHFGKLRWDRMLEAGPARPYGASASIHDLGDMVVGRFRDDLVLVGSDAREIEAAIDRLEGRAPATPPIAEDMAYGEIYGVLGAADLGRLLGEADPRLGDRFRQAAERVELHVGAERDVSIVAQVDGPDAAMVSDLGRSLGAALAVARARARDEEPELHEMLELARVRPEDGRFHLELALPLERIEEYLAGCREPSGLTGDPSAE